MDASELAVWEADYRQQPWDTRILSEQLAMQMTLLANVHRDSKKRREPFTVEDFTPGDSPRPVVPVETKAQRVARLKTTFRMLAGKQRKADVK